MPDDPSIPLEPISPQGDAPDPWKRRRAVIATGLCVVALVQTIGAGAYIVRAFDPFEPAALLPASIPVFFAGLATFLLRGRADRAIIGFGFLALAILGAWTIGPLYLPTAFLLVVAGLVTPPER